MTDNTSLPGYDLSGQFTAEQTQGGDQPERERTRDYDWREDWERSDNNPFNAIDPELKDYLKENSEKFQSFFFETLKFPIAREDPLMALFMLLYVQHHAFLNVIEDLKTDYDEMKKEVEGDAGAELAEVIKQLNKDLREVLGNTMIQYAEAAVEHQKQFNRGVSAVMSAAKQSLGNLGDVPGTLFTKQSQTILGYTLISMFVSLFTMVTVILLFLYK